MDAQEARKAIYEKFEDDWFCVRTGSGCTGSISLRALAGRNFLAETFGEEMLEAIMAEEYEKFSKTVPDPEAWHSYRLTYY